MKTSNPNIKQRMNNTMKTGNKNQFGSALIAALVVTVLVLAGASARAGMTWGPATGISTNGLAADSDVVTNGTLVVAYGLGFAPGTPANTYGSVTVNGVTFQNVSAAAAGLSVGRNVQQFGMAENGASAAPFSNLSQGYEKILGNSSYGYNQYDGVGTLTLSNLVAGHVYEFQWWDNDARGTGQYGQISTTATDGNSVTLLPQINPPAGYGQVGQYTVGTFTATGATEGITFSGYTVGSPPAQTDVWQINAYQLRDITIPEPSTALLLGVGGLMLWRRRRQSKMKE